MTREDELAWLNCQIRDYGKTINEYTGSLNALKSRMAQIQSEQATGETL